ncbi:MAG TPA: adenylate/guanylate cyclase domain-containing protein [Dongiaceae bacterium]|jgi:adenylate cyclase|nr:adenylate/guanylate cyclase domain-containing protein [Dongiaceae bacterium]
MADAANILTWLADGARSAATSEAVLAELCERLTAVGVPLSRVAVFVRTLNPNNIGRRFIWRPATPIEILDGDFDLFNRDEYLSNPIAVVQRLGKPIRRRLIDPNSPMDYPVLAEFKAAGMTDYLVSPLISTDGLIHVVSWSTTDPDGFSTTNIQILESVEPLLARVAEIRALRRTVVTLLDTYVGHQSGERILAGRVRRGDTEMIRAVIWLSDLRGFTELTDRLPGSTVITVLNRYFDCQIPPILERGGEVLKLIGDGLLAIFPVANEAAEAGVCDRALEAARDFRSRIEALSDPIGDGSPKLRFGLALHIGELLWGNIGGGNRLDFTSIGPAVNLAARLEMLAPELRRSVLVSADFARHCQGTLVPLGDFALKGFALRSAAFGLPEEQPGVATLPAGGA